MKLFAASLLLFSVCMFGGCIAEDTDSCPPDIQNNLILAFGYPDNQGTDAFADNIHQVDLFIFDREDHLVQRQTLDQASLSVFAGTQLSLQPGIYRLVCWGNALDRTVFSGVEPGNPLSEASLMNSILQRNNIVPNGDPLYYAPFPLQAFEITVSEQEVLNTQIAFCSAHIKIEVYVKGFEDKSASGEQSAPLIELTDVSQGYNFERQPLEASISYQSAASFQTIDGQQLAVINFYTPLFEENTPTQVLIKKQSDGSTLTTISLKDFIEKHDISLTGNTQVVIPILVEYKSVGVSITLPKWGQSPVDPELN